MHSTTNVVVHLRRRLLKTSDIDSDYKIGCHVRISGLYPTKLHSLFIIENTYLEKKLTIIIEIITNLGRHIKHCCNECSKRRFNFQGCIKPNS